MPNILEGKLKLPETMDSCAIPMEVKINNKTAALMGVTGKNTDRFTVGFGIPGTIKKGDTVKVSHKIADSGIAKFTNKTVTNNLN